uniref:Dephospho-CoA kinase domain-containing protein n=1 Tax=Bubo bubo TaxID=30461 RepID=A0A8C0EQ25_BUBBB
MFLVGLSGGIASGKSTVVAILRELGCAVIDADVIAREVVQPHFKAYRQIVRYFGTEILLENGEINREALGNIIFSHPEKRQLLNSITHPEIQKEMLKQILKHFVLGCRYVILDIPLLFETNRLTKFMKYTVLVYCDPPTQLSRLRKRNGLSHAEAEARIASQLPLDEKRRLATHVIDNSGERESTRRQLCLWDGMLPLHGCGPWRGRGPLSPVGTYSGTSVNLGTLMSSQDNLFTGGIGDLPSPVSASPLSPG